MKFTLKEPIQFGSETIKEIELKKPCAGDLRGMKMQPDLGDLLDLIGRLAGHPKSVIDKLSVDDLKPILSAVSDFL